MKQTKKLNALISTFLVLVMCVSALAFAPVEAEAYGETFIIDPGHGGNDPGALGSNPYREEQADNLRLSFLVGSIVSQYSSVAYTRTTEGTSLSLSQRCSIANSGGHKYFISIHRNSGGGYGIETFYCSNRSSTSSSAKMATAVQNALVEVGAPWRNRGVKTALFTVITGTNITACLTEVGFIDNNNDNKIYDDYFDQLALAIAKGMLAMIGVTPNAPVQETWQEKAAFDVMVYRDRNLDLAGMTDDELKKHWLEHGIKEGRASSPVLDLGFYLNNNQDLKDAYGTDYEKVYEHFITKGYKEKRKSSALFDGKYYTEHYPDAAAKGDDYMKYYVEHGILAGHRASLTFDPDYYWFINPPVWEAWPAHYEMCAKHYAGHGVRDQLVAYDNQAPVISDVTISNVSAEGYTVSCKVTDNWEISFVSFPTWTLLNDQDDIADNFLETQRGTKNGDVYTFNVKASDHNNEAGFYVTHIYAQDRGGNMVSFAADAIEVKDNATEITLVGSSSYVKDGNIVNKVASSTKKDNFLKQFENTGLKVKDAAGNEVDSSAFVGTGTAVELYDGETLVDQLLVIVLGDIDGNGIIDTTDYLRVKSAFLGNMTLDNCQGLAADVDGSGSIDGTDYIRIKGQFLGTFSI